MSALGQTSFWWGPSVSVGYRPTALGPRAIAGVAFAPDPGPRGWPARRLGGGWPVAHLPAPGALGDAQNAPGWPTPFDARLGQPWPGVNDVRQRPTPGVSGLGAVELRPWDHTMQPVVDPSFVFAPRPDGTVRYTNAPFYTRPMRNARQRPWPLYPTRGSFAGPYGAHALPFYAKAMRTTGATSIPGWPIMRTDRRGLIDPHYLADMSRYALPSRAYAHAHRAHYIRRVAPRADTAWPGAQYWLSRGRWDFRQEPRREEIRAVRVLP